MMLMKLYASKPALIGLAVPDWVGGDPELKAAIATSVLGEFERLMATEGIAAFEQPKSAACAHEAGHAIVGTALGDRISRVEVKRNRKFERMLGVPAWSGFTFTTDKCGRDGWRIGPDTPTDEMHARVCRLAAGIVAECMLDPEGCRSGSSLDELIVAQLVAGLLHERLGQQGHPRETWEKCWRWTATTIEHNAAAACELMAKLDLMGSIQGKPLAHILREVQPIGEEGAA